MEQKITNQTPVDVTKKVRFLKLKKLLSKRPSKKEWVVFGSICAAVLFVGSAAALTLFKNPETSIPEPVIQSTYVAPPVIYYSPLTGLATDEASTMRPVTAVMIENSIDARPQTGLQEAGIVFEAIAEGGITRFLAVFQEAQPNNFGPIRSARPYYVRWAAGYDARYIHSGGSGEALALIQSLGVKDLDHGRYGEQIASRVSSRYAPHNVYTSMKRADDLGNSLGYTTSSFTPFTRKPDNKPTPESPATATTIAFDISGANYNTRYNYDAETNSYPRALAGQPHTDQDSGKQISPKVVIGLIMSYGIHPDGIHSVYDNIGSGKAIVFQDGKMLEAVWKKSSDKASLEINDKDGKPLPLNAGQTWITAIPDGRITFTP